MHGLSLRVCWGRGYALGGELAKTMGGWQVICWALVISQPFILPFVVWEYTPAMWDVSWQTRAGFMYVCLFSQLIEFFPWYKGLAVGGVARVCQNQLLQPFFTIAVAMVLLGETLDAVTAIFAVLAFGLVAIGCRAAIASGEKTAD